MRSYFPDVNLWIALAYGGHEHHEAAASWLDEVNEALYFCRLTQIAFLRLLTQPRVMRDDVVSQQGAWRVYDALLQDPRIFFQVEPEPSVLETQFRKLAGSHRASAGQWSDAYLAAFARAADFQLVTFDRALHRLAGNGALLLG